MRRRTLLGLILATFALVTACANSGPSGVSASDSRHNEVDVSFATAMVLHHDQAIEMAQMARSRAKSGLVVTLAERIETTRDPEIADHQRLVPRLG